MLFSKFILVDLLLAASLVSAKSTQSAKPTTPHINSTKSASKASKTHTKPAACSGYTKLYNALTSYSAYQAFCSSLLPITTQEVTTTVTTATVT